LYAQLIELVERKTREESNPGIELEVGSLESTELDLFGPDHRGWVQDAPMSRHGLAWPDRADLACGLVAHGEDEVQRGAVRPSEFVPALRPEAIQLEVVSLQDFECERMDVAARMAPALNA
jgi:hypothetical protein